MPKKNRFKLRLSGRSGFQYLENDMVKEDGIWVGSDERDDPPPSKISLGGEGDISQGSYFRSSTSTDIDVDKTNPTFFITAAGGITPSYSHPYMRVTGSNSSVIISANPSIVAGVESKTLTLFCTDSSITINNGNGVATLGSTPIVMTSGSISVFFYSTSNTAWNETSRVNAEQGIGG